MQHSHATTSNLILSFKRSLPDWWVYIPSRRHTLLPTNWTHSSTTAVHFERRVPYRQRQRDRRRMCGRRYRLQRGWRMLRIHGKCRGILPLFCRFHTMRRSKPTQVKSIQWTSNTAYLGGEIKSNRSTKKYKMVVSRLWSKDNVHSYTIDEKVVLPRIHIPSQFIISYLE